MPATLTEENFETVLQFQTKRFEDLSEEEVGGDEMVIAYLNAYIADEVKEKFDYTDEEINAALFYYMQQNP